MAFSFNGSSQCVTCASAPVATLPLTLSARIWLTNLSGYYQAIALSAASAGGLITIQYGTGFGFRAWHNDDSGANQGAYYNTGIVSGQWYHLCGVFASNSSRQLYVDGVLRASSASAVGTTTIDRCVIGGRMMALGTSVTDLIPGRIQEVAAWNAALTAAEVAAIGNSLAARYVRPANRRLDAHLIRNLQDTRSGIVLTNVGAASVIQHTRRIG